MDLFEAAFFYGDYSMLREIVPAELFENFADTDIHDEFFQLEFDF